LILYVQRILNIRKHDGYPRLWEVLQQWAIFSVWFKVIIVRFPNLFRVARDALDILAYFGGGLLAWAVWHWCDRPVGRDTGFNPTL
jgi:hypothetical protein